MAYLDLTFEQKFALHDFSDATRDLASLLLTCPEPTSESDFAWEAEAEADEAWRVHCEWAAAEIARRENRLSQECPWLRLDDDFDGED